MSCSVYSSNNLLELYVTSWSTTLRSSMSPIIAQKNTWFESWTPDQETITMTIRQGDQDAQHKANTLLQFWQWNNTIVTLYWPERNMLYSVTVASAPYTEDYRNVVTDLTVTFNLITNMLFGYTVQPSISSNITGMISADLVDTTIESEVNRLNQASIQEYLSNIARSRKQWRGYHVTYDNFGWVTVEVPIHTKKDLHNYISQIGITKHNKNFVEVKQFKRFRTRLTGDFVQVMDSGSAKAIEHYLSRHGNSLGIITR